MCLYWLWHICSNLIKPILSLDLRVTVVQIMMQLWRLCRVLSLVISTIVTLRSVASQTVCSGAFSRCRTQQRDSSPALVDVIILLQSWGNSTGFRSDESTSSWPSWCTRRCMIQLQRTLSMTVSSFLTQAVAGYDRPTSTRVMFHGRAHGSATRALQPLDRGYGTVCRPGFASPTMYDIGEFVSS